MKKKHNPEEEAESSYFKHHVLQALLHMVQSSTHFETRKWAWPSDPTSCRPASPHRTQIMRWVLLIFSLLLVFTDVITTWVDPLPREMNDYGKSEFQSKLLDYYLQHSECSIFSGHSFVWAKKNHAHGFRSQACEPAS